jgi:hypothetical protein
MANIKPMIEHIARGLVSPVDWDDLSGPTKAVALAKATHLLADAPVLYDALRDDKLRELAAYFESRAPRDEDGCFTSGYYESMYESPAYSNAAKRLRAILDGE